MNIIFELVENPLANDLASKGADYNIAQNDLGLTLNILYVNSNK